jgi:hypothetical protein
MSENPCRDGHLGQEPDRRLRDTPGIWELRDARGIGCGYVCGRCVKWKKSGYRPEVFSRSNYWHDEPIHDD